MTSARRPSLLAGVLAPLRELAGEIVVAAETPRAESARAALAGVADKVLAFPATTPPDRPIAWLFRSCSGGWIFNIDDDEVPSPGLVESLAQVVRRDDITHAWVARRWLHPTRDTYIASPPWGTEFQLRLALADDRFLRFSDEFHRPVVCHGPGVYLGEPLWHLDTTLNPAAQRRRKAAAYESERPGMRIGGLSHNLGMYVPELHPSLDLRAVPEEDRRAIERALAHDASPAAPQPTIRDVAPGEIDAHWVGPPYPSALYRGAVEVTAAGAAMPAGVQQTVDVRVVNGSDVVWGWGRDARPAIRLGYRWRRDGAEVHEPAALRTILPADLEPGGGQLVPVHVVAPTTPGVYELELDLVHEPARWFGVGEAFSVTVESARSVTIVARPTRVAPTIAELELAPGVEPLVLLRDPADASAYGDFAVVPGLRRYLLRGSSGSGRLRTLARLLARTAVLVRATRRPQWSEPGYGAVLVHLRSSEALVVDGPNWEPDAAFGREWAWVAVTALLWRSTGKDVVIPDAALPGGMGLRIAAVRALLRLLRTGS